jgi:uncharacterized protein YciI
MTTQMTMIPVHMGTTSRWLRTLRLQAGSLLERALRRIRHARRCFPHLDKGFQEIASGPLLSDEGRVVLGATVLLKAPHAEGARDLLAADQYVGVEVRQWQPGGRPG